MHPSICWIGVNAVPWTFFAPKLMIHRMICVRVKQESNQRLFRTHTFVMWRCGVAISSSPEGPFTYLRSFRPQGKIWHVISQFLLTMTRKLISSNHQRTMPWCISPSSLKTIWALAECFKEFLLATMLKLQRYSSEIEMVYITSSALDALHGSQMQPNAAKFAIASSVWGPWHISGNSGDDSNITTFHSQSTHIILVSNDTNTSSYIFAADKWNMNNLSD